jgi:hypothetical protein
MGCPVCGDSGWVETGSQWHSWESGSIEDDREWVPCDCEAGERRRGELPPEEPDDVLDDPDYTAWWVSEMEEVYA